MVEARAGCVLQTWLRHFGGGTSEPNEGIPVQTSDTGRMERILSMARTPLEVEMR